MGKAFAMFLQEVNGGRTHADLSAKLEELLQAVQQNAKAGSLTLTINVKPASRSDTVDKIIISDKITLKKPELARAEDIFWLSDDAEPVRDNPRQQKLDFYAVENTLPTTFKEVAK